MFHPPSEAGPIFHRLLAASIPRQSHSAGKCIFIVVKFKLISFSRWCAVHSLKLDQSEPGVSLVCNGTFAPYSSVLRRGVLCRDIGNIRTRYIGKTTDGNWLRSCWL